MSKKLNRMAFEVPILARLRAHLARHIDSVWQRDFADLAPSYQELRFKNHFFVRVASHVNHACQLSEHAKMSKAYTVSPHTIRRALDLSHTAGFYDTAKQAISIYLGYQSWEHYMREATNPSPEPPIAYEPAAAYGRSVK